MRVMWVCNGPVSMINKVLIGAGKEGPSWIEGLLRSLRTNNEIELAYCFPQGLKPELIKSKVNDIQFFGFYRENRRSFEYDRKIDTTMKEIINEFKPEIVHVFGTEFPHAFSAVKAFGDPDRTVISIQGLCHIIAKHYFADLPQHVIRMYTFRDLIRNDNIKKQAKRFEQRGMYEIESIKNVSHIIGRTDLDKACCVSINPKAEYHFCNEVLRDSFYNNKWDINSCDRHSIFFSQCYYPVKGFHFMLEALAQIKKRYPDVHLFVAGYDITKVDTLKDRLRITSYGLYIRKLTRKYDLDKNITFLGQLSGKDMCDRFLKANVFVSASSIENSPNSVGEAMKLGVPVVCSDVGGVKNLLTHEADGFIYQWNAPYMLAYYIEKIFSDDELALRISKSAQQRANDIYDRESNLASLCKIYKSIVAN